MKQQDLNNYFSTIWKSNLDQYQYSGWALVNKIQSNELVLDVGCGFNEFKSRILNLTGIDPANDRADVKLPIEEHINEEVDYEKIDDTNYEYVLEELKKTEWEYSFIARLDEKEKNTRSLIFISKTLGIRAYVRNIN